jgi:nitroreductase
MKSLHDLLVARRTVRKYTDEPLTPDEVKTILEAALLAPAGKHQNPWQFVVVEEKETLRMLSKAKEHGAGPIEGAALAIVITCNPYTSETWIEDGSIAATLIQLTCADLGLGSCWVQIRGRYTASGQPAEEATRMLLNIPPDQQVLAVIAIGRPAEEKAPHNLDELQWEKIHIGEWRNDVE